MSSSSALSPPLSSPPSDLILPPDPPKPTARTPLPHWPLAHLRDEEPARPLYSQENLALAHNDVVTYHKVRALAASATIVLVAMSRQDFEEYAGWKIGREGGVAGATKHARTKQKKKLFSEEHLGRVARESRAYWKRMGFEWAQKGGSLKGYLVGMEGGGEVEWFAASRGVEEDRGVEEWRRKKVQEHNEMVAALREAEKAEKEDREEVVAGAGVFAGGEMTFVSDDDDDLYDAWTREEDEI